MVNVKVNKIVCVLIFFYNFEIFLILRRIQLDITINYVGLHLMYPFSLLDFNYAWISSIDFTQIIAIKFHESSFRWEPSYCMSSDRHDEANICVFVVVLCVYCCCCLVCIVVSCLVCIVVVLCVLLVVLCALLLVVLCVLL